MGLYVFDPIKDEMIKAFSMKEAWDLALSWGYTRAQVEQGVPFYVKKEGSEEYLQLFQCEYTTSRRS